MKKHILTTIIAISTTILILAQTATVPKPADWRFSYSWEDPNPVGTVTMWNVYASNNAAVRMTRTTARTVKLQALLDGAPLGVYAFFTTAETALGDVSAAGTNTYVRWLGKVNPGHGGNVEK